MKSRQRGSVARSGLASTGSPVLNHRGNLIVVAIAATAAPAAARPARADQVALAIPQGSLGRRDVRPIRCRERRRHRPPMAVADPAAKLPPKAGRRFRQCRLGRSRPTRAPPTATRCAACRLHHRGRAARRPDRCEHRSPPVPGSLRQDERRRSKCRQRRYAEQLACQRQARYRVPRKRRRASP